MTGHTTPHIRACAATSEIRYVVSLITYLNDCMQARNKLFSVLGLTNIKGFRETFNVVLPRIVLVVDEFQQLFLEATTREANVINELIMGITKLGRAVGFHLIFASQEMSGALSGKALANFKIRFALPCEPEISSAILGNSQAVELKVGEVYVNTESGNIEKNMKFKVPYIEVDEELDDDGNVIKKSDFNLFLSALESYSKITDFKKIGKYYNEDSCDNLDLFEENVLKNKKFKMRRKEISSDIRFFDIITLGNSVVYNDKTYDIETFFVERGKSKNILAVSPQVSDISYITKLLSTNIKNSADIELAKVENHLFFSLNSIADQLYDIGNEVYFELKKYESADNLDRVYRTFQYRNLLIKTLDLNLSIYDFTKEFWTNYCKLLTPEVEAKIIIEKVNELLVKIDDLEISEYCDNLLEDNNISPIMNLIANVLKAYAERKEGVKGSKIFKPFVIWISGLENIDKLPTWFNTVLKNAMDLNMLFILLTTSDESARTVLPVCDYIFVGGTNPKTYERLGVNYTNKSRDSIALDFKIRSLNTERSFKKYKVEQNQSVAPSINFDSLL